MCCSRWKRTQTCPLSRAPPSTTPSVRSSRFPSLLDASHPSLSAGLYNPPPADPRFSPLLYPAHIGVAPAYVQGLEHDPLRDDARAYAAALRAAGVPVRYIQCVVFSVPPLVLPSVMC